MSINFYKGRVALNCLTNSVQNAKDIMGAIDGYAVVGLLSANYPDIPAAVEDMKRYQLAADNNISVGLGAGNPNQWRAVAEISSQIIPKHINQTFTAGGYTRAKVGEKPFINSMVAPCGKPGYVKLSTGPLSAELDGAIAPVETAVAMAKEQGANSLKYFPMGGLKVKDELVEVAKVCAKTGFALEPTGGIDLANFSEILSIILDAGVELVIPHIYSSIIDKETGDTRIDDVTAIYSIMKKLLA